jgi:hypothetical protein
MFSAEFQDTEVVNTKRTALFPRAFFFKENIVISVVLAMAAVMASLRSMTAGR